MVNQNLLDLPDLILEKIGSKLKKGDFRNFRLTCQKFYIISLCPTIMKNITIDFRKVQEKDIGAVHSFLENIDYGRHGKFITSDAKYDVMIAQNKIEEYFNFATKIRNVTCEISLLRQLTNCCPELRSMSLKDTKNVKQYHNIWQSNDEVYCLHVNAFSNTYKALMKFTSLRTLEIQGIGSVPVGALQEISSLNTLTTLSISYGVIMLNNETIVKNLILNGSFEPSVEIKNRSVTEWSFGHIDTDGFKLIIPETACSVFKSYSPNILWHSKPRELKTLTLNERKFADFKQELPRKLDHLHLKLPHENLFLDPSENMNIDMPFILADSTLFYTICNIANYTQLTLSRTLQPELVKLLLCNRATSSLVKLHLINSPVDSVCCGSRETYSTRAFEWYDNDIINILSFQRQIKTLVLENFFDISAHLIELISHHELDLNLLRVMNCCGFSKTDFQSHLKVVKFKIDVIEDIESRWGRIFYRNLERRLRADTSE